MGSDERDLHISQMQTRWVQVLEAFELPEARNALVLRYFGAVHRYLIGALRDLDAADDLAQQFAQRFLECDMTRVDPRRGRFRDYVKAMVCNLLADHRRKAARRPPPPPEDVPEPADPDRELPDLDRQLLDGLRNELLARAWEGLVRIQEQSAQPFYTVLRFRAEHPEIRSPEMAEQLSGRLGRSVTAVWVRQVLLRARGRFEDLVVAEVASSVEDATPERVEQELIDLDLLDYCRSGLERYKGRMRSP